LDTLFQYLARKICRVFKTTVKPDDCWDEYLGAKENITEFIKESLLEQAQSPVLLLMDEVDRLFNQPYRDDFFAAVRGWHNLRAAEECWNNLNLVIAHSTEPYLWIQDINQSPFNVGFKIELEDFNFQQVTELNTKHGNPLKTGEQIRELLYLTGGQPYLVRLALYTMVKSNYSITRLKETATEDRGPFGDHLRQILWRLQGKKGLSDSLRQILRKGMCDHEPHFLRLRSAGLVKGETRHQVQMRCQLYEDYLRKHL
ncbi:MAG: AAA-like domain-containing protein, partial [Candidatus Aminicenantes bacterium]